MRGLRPGRARTSLRRGAIGTLLILLITPALGLTAAHAQENYRFWGYYNWSDDSWKLAQTGPADVKPEDGDVDGWRFAIGMDEPRPPRADGDFQAICGDTPKESGKKRVAVVMDYGIEDEAPGKDEVPDARGECAVVQQQASSDQVLSAVADVRAQKGLTCGIDGYPSSGCGEAVEEAPDIELPEPSVELALPDSGSSENGKSDNGKDTDAPGSGNEQADQAQQEDAGSGIGVWAAVAIVAIVLIVGGTVLARLRGRNRA